MKKAPPLTMEGRGLASGPQWSEMGPAGIPDCAGTNEGAPVGAQTPTPGGVLGRTLP